MQTSFTTIRGDRGDELVFDSLDCPVFFFQGAFSPPHKGHWLQIENILHQFKNSRVIINQLGERHDFPEKVVRTVFQTYIDQSPFHQRIDLLYRRSPFSVIKSKQLNGATHFIMIRGFEPLKHFDLEKCRTYEITQKISELLLERGVKTVLFMVGRDQDKTGARFSSTQFTSFLRSRSVRDRVSLYQFIPDHIKEKHLIVKMLLSRWF